MSDLNGPVFRQTAYCASLINLLIASGLVLSVSWRWSAAVLTGHAWVLLNTYFLFRLFDAAFIRPKSDGHPRVGLMLFFKFPVLYVAGYFLLRSGVFPVWGILVGLTVFSSVLCANWFLITRKTGSL